METGKLIVFEGIGGSGKSTQAEMLYRALSQDYPDILLTREHTRDRPFGATIEEIIKGRTRRVDLLALQYGFIADRLDHWRQDVAPVIIRGGVAISDRWYGSTIAYAPPEWREYLLRANQEVVKSPEITFVVDLDPELAITRVTNRGGADFFDKQEVLRRCREGYEWFLYNSGDECVWIDGNRPKEVVHGQIVEEIKVRGIL